MVTGRIPLENTHKDGFLELIHNKDQHIKILVSPNLAKQGYIKLTGSYNGTSSNIATVFSLPTVTMTSPIVLLTNPASQYAKQY